MTIVVRVTSRGERRYDVRLRRPDGRVQNRTFRTRRDAEAYEREQLITRDRGNWIDPRGGRARLGAYAEAWLTGRTVRGRALAPRTLESYRYLLDSWVLPAFGSLPLAKVTVESVRSWHADLLRSAPPSVAPKAYRVLHAIIRTAVEDGLVAVSPCRIKGAGMEHAAERPTLTPDDVAALAEAIDPRWRALVLLAAYGGLRFGELVGLRRRDVDLRGATVQVGSQLVETAATTRIRTGPKSEAGRRKVAVPAFVADELRAHMVAYVPADLDAPVFAGARGGLPLRRNWARIWSRARARAGVPSDVHLHDLRHVAGTLAAQSGGTIREIMARLGHSSPGAALVYQHAVDNRDRAIAAALNEVGRQAVAARQSGSAPSGARDGRAMEAR